jgi:hypothetical protein
METTHFAIETCGAWPINIEAVDSGVIKDEFLAFIKRNRIEYNNNLPSWVTDRGKENS